MPAVGELIDQAVALPPGPGLAALLAELPFDGVPNDRLVEVVQAHSRQLAHTQAELFAGLAEIARATPVAGLGAGVVAAGGGGCRVGLARDRRRAGLGAHCGGSGAGSGVGAGAGVAGGVRRVGAGCDRSGEGGGVR